VIGPGNSYDFVYEHTDIPQGMTIRAWRAQQARQHPARRRARAHGNGFAPSVRAALTRLTLVWRSQVRHSSGAHGSMST